MKINSSEKGQALIIIAFAAVALFAFAALAIDGSMVFSDKRHAQNAADTAAMAAALAKLRDQDYVTAAKTRATSNGYDNLATNDVEIYNPPKDGSYAGNSEYIQVIITSYVPTTFARVIGRQQFKNVAEAVARAKLPVSGSWFDGKAMVSTMTGCGGGGTPNPFTVGGNGTTVINNSGIFVNSSCVPAFFDNGNSNLVTTDEGVCVIGGIQAGVNGVTPPPDGYCDSPQIDINDYPIPDPSSYCSSAGSITGSGGNYEAWPGYFNKTGNKTFPDVSPAGTLKLHKGVYCLYNGMSLNASWTITSDLNGNGHDPDSEGILFYVPGGDVALNGGSTLNVHAISSGLPDDLLNYLFIVPLSNSANVTITGNNGSSFTGAIFAPKSECTMDGSGNTFSLDTQIICYNNTITGAGTVNITFNAGNNPTISDPGNIQLVQ